MSPQTFVLLLPKSRNEASQLSMNLRLTNHEELNAATRFQSEVAGAFVDAVVLRVDLEELQWFLIVKVTLSPVIKP
jgi:hypothetical protein